MDILSISLQIYGGVPKPAQQAVLRKGVDCVVGTPGRLKDLINDGSCDLSKISNLVLDEADRMLVSAICLAHIYALNGAPI